MGNMCNLHTFYSMLVTKEQIWTRDIDRSAPATLLNALNETLEVGELTQHTLKKYEGRALSYFTDNTTCTGILPIGVFHRRRRLRGLQFCPMCLATDPIPFFRTRWRLTSSFICTEHECFLNNQCHFCKAPIQYHRLWAEYNRVDICPICESDLRVSPIHHAPEQLVKAQSVINDAIDTGWYHLSKTRTLMSAIFLDGLYHFCRLFIQQAYKQDFINACKVELDFPLPVEKELLCIKSNLELNFSSVVRAYAFSFALLLTPSWPKRFIQLFKQLDWRSQKIYKHRETLPFWLDEVIKRYFYEPTYQKSLLEIESGIRFLLHRHEKVTPLMLAQLFGTRPGDMRIIKDKGFYQLLEKVKSEPN